MKHSLFAVLLLTLGSVATPAQASVPGISEPSAAHTASPQTTPVAHQSEHSMNGSITSAHRTAFYCNSEQPSAQAKKTVLLVHGVGTNGEGTYSWNYQNSLRDAGYDVCLINLPRSGRANLVESAGYVASGIRLAYERLNKPVAVIGHSAGPTATLWALRYDHEAATKVDDFISLAGALHGTTFVEPVCQVVGSCPAIGWQMSIGSNFMRAMHAQPLPDHISATSIYSRTDYGIQPADKVSVLDGASNIAVQDVCAGKVPGHLGILGDPAVYDIVMDALTHDGPADATRLKNVDCYQRVAPGVDLARSLKVVEGLPQYVQLLTEPRLDVEPKLPDYAAADLEANRSSYEKGEIGISEVIAGSSQNFGTALSDAARYYAG